MAHGERSGIDHHPRLTRKDGSWLRIRLKLHLPSLAPGPRHWKPPPGWLRRSDWAETISGSERDDLTGLGGGGNKVRKLEWICGAAVARGADTLVTCGARQSNHARLTAAAGARLGLEVVLVLAGAKGGPRTGNIALDGLLGATVVWAGDTVSRRA